MILLLSVTGGADFLVLQMHQPVVHSAGHATTTWLGCSMSFAFCSIVATPSRSPFPKELSEVVKFRGVNSGSFQGDMVLMAFCLNTHATLRWPWRSSKNAHGQPPGRARACGPVGQGWLFLWCSETNNFQQSNQWVLSHNHGILMNFECYPRVPWIF